MEGKLIKTDGTYILSINEHKDEVFAIADFDKATKLDKHKLSLENCQAIENGYDLDELAYTDSEDFVDIFDYNDGYGNICRFNNSHEVQECYIKGFQKALELLGDKKFSVKDMEKLMFATIEFTEQKEGETYPFLKSFIQSLQPKEWDVEIEMENKQQLTNGYKNQPDNVIGFIAAYENVVVPKLDEDGCLILRRI